MTRIQSIINSLMTAVQTTLPSVPVEFSEEAAYASGAIKAVAILPLPVVPEEASSSMVVQGVEARFAIVLMARGQGALAAVEAMDELVTPTMAAPPVAGCQAWRWLGDEFDISPDTSGLMVAKRCTYSTAYTHPRWQRS